jgi:hypothetical protein
LLPIASIEQDSLIFPDRIDIAPRNAEIDLTIIDWLAESRGARARRKTPRKLPVRDGSSKQSVSVKIAPKARSRK